MRTVSVAPPEELVYQAFPDMDLPETGTLNKSRRECLDEIGEWLVSRGAEDRFGISLLHSHFELREGEVLVETADVDRRIVVTRPLLKREVLALHAVPTNFCFAAMGEDAQLQLIALEYSSTENNARQIDSSDYEVLAGVYEILNRKGQLGTFGVTLVHEDLAISESEVLAETCFRSLRELRCQVLPRLHGEVQNSIETVWRWRARGQGADTSPLRASERVCTRVCTYNTETMIHNAGVHTY